MGAGRRPPDPVCADAAATDGWQVRVVQPYQALKQYRCPGCDHEIQPRTLHVVAWPDGAADDRRHWHRPCWERYRAEQERAAARRTRR